MPRQNCFRHQPYAVRESPPIPTSVSAVRPAEVADVNVGETLRELRVRNVVLVHGTFVGTDPLGLAARLDDLTESVSPMLRPLLKSIAVESWGRVMRSINQQFADKVMGETGSFRDDYVAEFQQLIGDESPKVERFDWTSANDHAARAEAAIALFHRLSGLEADWNQDRVLLWGHSHAGNVFALLTNLLANDRESVVKFFEITKRFVETRDSWKEARARLAVAPSPHPLSKGLCLVTFGTPVRHGWDRDGYSRLLHVVHHRPADGLPLHQARPALPQSVDDIRRAAYGDWVQSLGIAGTDLAPLDATTRELHRALGEWWEDGLAEPELGNQKTILDHLPDSARQRVREHLQDILTLHERWRCGTRVPTDGDAAWLFDYGTEETAKFGHGVYTKRVWLPFHATRIADWLRHSMERK